MTDVRPAASISIDVDDLWSYLKTHGDSGWESRPSYLPTFIPLVLDALDRAGVSVTFFLVGVDAANPRNHRLFQEMVTRGHEVGNHSYQHEPWLHLYTPMQLETEIQNAEEAIASAAGQRPTGFRGPGYSWSPDLLRVLLDRGYHYDASTLPTYLGPLARAYYFRTARLTPVQMAERRGLFGEFRDGRRAAKPYLWRMDDGRSLLEIPVTTFPGVKTPFHLSYLLYLSRHSLPLARAYLRTALKVCRLTNTGLSFLIHPLDILDADHVPQLAFFPGMDLPGATKQQLFADALRLIAEEFRPVTMGAHARALRSPDGGLAAGHGRPAASLRAVDAR